MELRMTILFIALTLQTLIALYLLNIRIPKLKREFEEREKEIRKEAIKSSKDTINGQNMEKMIPLFKDFPYNIQDLRFLGSPIDYIVFDGLHDKTFGDKSRKVEIVIAEVKTGESRQTIRQRAIKEAVKDCRIRFEEWRVNNDKIEIK